MFIEVYYKHASTVARKVRGELCPWLKANTARLVRNREHQQREEVHITAEKDKQLHSAVQINLL